MATLKELESDTSSTSDTRADAAVLITQLCNYEFVVLLGFWDSMLMSIDRIQKRLQDPVNHLFIPYTFFHKQLFSISPKNCLFFGGKSLKVA